MRCACVCGCRGDPSLKLYISELLVLPPLRCMLRAQATQEVVSRVPESTQVEMTAAVDAAQNAFQKWRRTPIVARQRIMFKLQQLIRENTVRNCNTFVCVRVLVCLCVCVRVLGFVCVCVCVHVTPLFSVRSPQFV